MTIPELLDHVYREAWREAGGHIPTIAKRLGVSESRIRTRATALGLLADSARCTRRGCSAAEAMAIVRERLKQGMIPYFGSPIQRALIAAGEARIVAAGPYPMLEAI